MSSGSTIPYHLRQNKAVERILFEEKLKILDSWVAEKSDTPIERYRYVGFGGPFLEDFKSIHRNLNITDMVSIESDENTLRRQQFNKPISCIKLLPEAVTSSEFIASDQFEKKTILWLDYVNTEYVSQLDDVKNAIEKMSEFDVLKVTLNAHVANLKDKGRPETLQQDRLEFFEEKIPNEYLPSHLDSEDFTAKNFHKVLLKTIHNAFSAGTANKANVEAVILSSFVYQDGQRMLTATCILLSSENKNDFSETSKLKDWEFYYGKNQEIYDISLPSLSVRERVEIERLLPRGAWKT